MFINNEYENVECTKENLEKIINNSDEEPVGVEELAEHFSEDNCVRDFGMKPSYCYEDADCCECWINCINKTYFKEENRILQVSVTDELGTHTLQSLDYIIKCKKCGKERPLYESDINKDNEIEPKKCECGGKNVFSYWLDRIYSEEEYRQLEEKAKKNK